MELNYLILFKRKRPTGFIQLRVEVFFLAFGVLRLSWTPMALGVDNGPNKIHSLRLRVLRGSTTAICDSFRSLLRTSLLFFDNIFFFHELVGIVYVHTLVYVQLLVCVCVYCMCVRTHVNNVYTFRFQCTTGNFFCKDLTEGSGRQLFFSKGFHCSCF